MGDTAWTGRSVTRGEDHDFLTGQALYTADLRDPRLRGAAHVAFVRSPFAAAEIVNIETADAVAGPGVVAVVTAAGIADLHPAPYALPFPDEPAQPILATGAVRFAGETVAAVVADSAAQAVDAAERVVVDYREQSPMLDLNQARHATPVEPTRSVADPAPDLFDGCEIDIEVEVWNPRQTAASIEPRLVAAVWEDDRLEVWAATQRPHGFRDTLAKFLGIDPDLIHVVAPAVGGGFGGKTSRTAEEHLVPALARMVERPVVWHGTRADEFATSTHCRGELVTMRLGGTRDGRITALRADLLKDGGAYPLVGVMLPDGYTRPMANGCYDIAHVEFSSLGVLTNRVPTSAYRGAGRAPYVDTIERAVDVFAAEAGLDPAEVRRRNLITPAQMPYETPTGGRYDEADYPGDLERALSAAGYHELRAHQAAQRADGASRVLGIGLATYNHMTTGGGGEEASVTVDADGTATVVTGTTSQGHGHATTWAQIAADALGMHPDDIRVVEGDTAAIATGMGAVGSRSLQTAGIAVHRSASEVFERARELAAQLLEAAPEDITATPGTGLHVVGTPTVSISWAEAAAAGIGSPRELSCGEFYDTEGRNTYPSGCHIAVVEVDTETGMWTLERFIAVDDAGPRVNPTIVEGQLHGGIASGVGQVFGEVMAWDDFGTPVTTNFADYPLATSDQLPSFEMVASGTPSSFNQLGFKGVGESGTIGAAPAVHNAVIDALSHLGVRHIDLPCTPQRVWDAIHKA